MLHAPVCLEGFDVLFELLAAGVPIAAQDAAARPHHDPHRPQHAVKLAAHRLDEHSVYGAGVGSRNDRRLRKSGTVRILDSASAGMQCAPVA
jgi:hypothetical protein